MKPVMRLALLLLIATATFTSCKKSAPKQTKFIPKEAVVVTTINTKQLRDKLTSNEATLENLFKTLREGNDTVMDKGKKEWEDFKNSGVDLSENIYLAVLNKGGGSMVKGSGSSIISVVGALKDAGKLEAYIKKKDATLEIRKEKDYSYAQKEDNMVAWGKDVVIMMTSQSNVQPMMEYDSVNHSYNMKPGQGNVKANLAEEMTRYFNLKEDETVASITEFRDLLQNKADASFWVNSASNMENFPIPLPKVKELFANSYTAATLNFEDGKMVINSKSYTSKAMSDLLEKYKGSNADLSLIENYPSNNIDGFTVFSINPQLIYGIVQYLEVGAMVDGYLAKMMGPNYKLQDALKAIKGDFALVVSDVSVVKSTTTQMGMPPASKPHAKVLLNVPVGDKAQLNKLLDKLVEQHLMIKANNNYMLNPAMRAMGVQVSVDDKNLLVSTDSMVLVQYKARSGKAALNKDVMNDFKDKSAVAYVDIEKIMNAFPADDTTAAKVLSSAKATFRDMKGYADNFNGKFVEGHYELRFKNEKENSLTSLLNFVTVAAQNAKKAKVTWSTDSVDVRRDTSVTNPQP